MRFGELAIDEAVGAVLVHTTRAGDLVLKKGRVLDRRDVTALAGAGVTRVICAVLEPDDVPEDAAAWAVAHGVAGGGTRLEPAKTGRCNLFATHAGLCLVSPQEIQRINGLDERITVATLADGTSVREGAMVATVKIIPFSVPAPLLASVVRISDASDKSVRDSDDSNFVVGNDIVRIADDVSTSVRSPDNDSDGLVLDGRTPDGRTPDGHHPDGRHPDGRHPDAHTPDARTQDDRTSDAHTPDAHTSDGHHLDAHHPDGRHPDAHHPDAHHPDGHHPDGHHPDAHHPDGRHPDDHHPDAHHPDAHHPDAHHPDAHHPDDRTPGGHHPDADDRTPHQLDAIRVAPWLGCRAGLVLTRFADTHPSLLARAEAAQRERMTRCGGQLISVRTVPHQAQEVAQALRELAAEGLSPLLALGASAIMDRRDVIPTAIEQAGGTLIRFGMPVDPGNLLLLGSFPSGSTDTPTAVIGVPGCARSLKRSGFDWVLERVCAGVPVTSGEIAALGVGGLLDEIEQRPAPRAPGPELVGPHTVAAVVLAAGLGSRMGSAKLLEPLEGRPLVRWAVEAALASRARPVIVVTGHRGDDVAAALAGLPVTIAHNPGYAEGMASSLRMGISRVTDADAAVVCLGDMPKVTAEHIDRLLAAFDPRTAPIVVPTHQRKRGNPVLWARRFFPEIAALQGDVGARGLLERHAEELCLLSFEDPAILLDVDTPQALAQLRHSPLSAE